RRLTSESRSPANGFSTAARTEGGSRVSRTEGGSGASVSSTGAACGAGGLSPPQAVTATTAPTSRAPAVRCTSANLCQRTGTASFRRAVGFRDYPGARRQRPGDDELTPLKVAERSRHEAWYPHDQTEQEHLQCHEHGGQACRDAGRDGQPRRNEGSTGEVGPRH